MTSFQSTVVSDSLHDQTVSQSQVAAAKIETMINQCFSQVTHIDLQEACSRRSGKMSSPRRCLSRDSQSGKGNIVLLFTYDIPPMSSTGFAEDSEPYICRADQALILALTRRHPCYVELTIFADIVKQLIEIE